MKRLPWRVLWLVMLCGNIGRAWGADASVEQRIQNRAFPSIFQAWNPADNMPAEPWLTTLARHDLVWHSPVLFGLQWNNAYQGLADGFTTESVEKGREFRKKLLKLNPNMILIAEIRYRDAHKSYLPDSHRWWLRGKNGEIVPGWEEGGYMCLDFHHPEYRQHVAIQCQSTIRSGVFDGVMLDWWGDDDSRLALVREVRRAIGDEALIITNANDQRTPRTAPCINGYFMECTKSTTAGDWRQIADTLVWAEAHLKSPRVNCLETWFHQSRDDLNLMRATTTLSLTLSDGYCLFSDPNPLPVPDHLHNWYPFWNRSLGRPTGKGSKNGDGTYQREFEEGTVVYNPMGNGRAAVKFRDVRTSVGTGRSAREHDLKSPDGDIYLKSQCASGSSPAFRALTDSSGKPLRLILHQNSHNMPGKKIE